MIALHEQELLVEFQSGRLVIFERRWLHRSLTLAAQQAGYEKWWLADHVTESVATYFADHLDLRIVGIQRLQLAVTSVLETIGYSEVAQHFDPVPPPVEINLFTLAIEADTGFELIFFQMLQRKIEEAIATGSEEFRFTGVHACAKRLTSSKIWCGDCQHLRGEILEFVDRRMLAIDRPNLTYCVS